MEGRIISGVGIFGGFASVAGRSHLRRVVVV